MPLAVATVKPASGIVASAAAWTTTNVGVLWAADISVGSVPEVGIWAVGITTPAGLGIWIWRQYFSAQKTTADYVTQLLGETRAELASLRVQISEERLQHETDRSAWINQRRDMSQRITSLEQGET